MEYVYSRVIEISTLSNYDYALINATWLNLTNEEFQCKKIESMYEKRSDAEIVIKMRRIERGCGELTNSPKIEIDKIGFHSCLCHENFQHPQIGYYMSILSNYEKGILPFDGCLMDQPNQIMEVIGLMSTLKTEREIAEQEKANKKGK